MSILYYFILTQSILISCIIGLVKYPDMDSRYRPFFFACLADLFTEIVVYCLIRRHIYPSPVSNTYVLVSSLIFIWMFKQWGLFGKSTSFYRTLFAFQAACWVTEHFVLDSIHHVTPFYRIESSFLIVLLSLFSINKFLVRQKGSWLRNTQFIICIGLIVFYTYNIFIEVIYLKSGTGTFIQEKVFDIKRYVNVFVNLLFAFAMLWVPVKKRFTMLY